MSSSNVCGSQVGGVSMSGTTWISCREGRSASLWGLPICTSSRGEGGRSLSSYISHYSLSSIGEGSSVSFSTDPLATN